MKRFVQTGLAVALALASGAAAALGLGQLELKSKRGEPLLAEIPIISSDPRELEQLQAALASPETFARVGLDAPDPVVARLHFTSALDARGRPVIRVTSDEPIQQALLTFLVEVDWGQGRLVREYSALLDAPRTVSAPLQPPIQAPVAPPANTIVRQPPVQPAPTPRATPAPLPTPRPADNAIATQRPAARAPATTPAAPSLPPERYGKVEQGQTLSQIASELDLGVDLDQAMIALLRANPDAFIDGNVNLIKQGAVLRVPRREELRAIDAAQASALVRSQVRQWREAQPPAPQPALAEAAQEAPAQASPARPAAAASGARLEIVPPGASDATRAGTQSGIAAGGEGDMQRQELVQTRETLAARDAEVAELKSRLAELEQLQAKQQKLLAMKDTELAAAQQRLAQAGDTAADGEPAQATSSLPWVFGGAIVLLLALIGGWLARRRAASAPRFRAPERGSIADAFADGSYEPVRAEPVGEAVPLVAVEPADQSELALDPQAPAGPGSEDRPVGAAQTAETDDAPLWDRRRRDPVPSRRAPAWHADASVPPADPAAGLEDAPANERLELARAYLDLGDRDNARQLLDEIASNGDREAREQATRMLREIE